MEAYAARGKLVKTLLLGNLLGALLTWSYFTFIDYPATSGRRKRWDSTSSISSSASR